MCCPKQDKERTIIISIRKWGVVRQLIWMGAVGVSKVERDDDGKGQSDEMREERGKKSPE